jgi:hypothetical protein
MQDICLKRARLAEILCSQPTDLTDEEIFERRVETIDLIVTLSSKRELLSGSHPAACIW